ncbi:DUF4035 domain-containing protein [Escherichia coli]|nr:DUF4035 domain-containing protein [Escherichia coli]
MWAEFDRFSPLGDERADIRAAQIVSAVYGAQGVKVPLNDALLQWETRADRRRLRSICRTGKRAFNSVSVSQHNRFGGFFRPENECGDIT